MSNRCCGHVEQSLDRIKCRLLEGTNAQEVRAMVLDMQARLLLDMLGKGIESALVNPSALVAEPWQASGETLAGIDPESMAYFDAILDLASHFITRLRRYASFCRTLASHAVTAGTGNNRSVVTSPTQSSVTPAASQGSCREQQAKLRMRLRGAKAQLDAIHHRYKQVNDESDTMNKKYEEAVAILKGRLASKGMEVLHLKKQLTVGFGKQK